MENHEPKAKEGSSTWIKIWEDRPVFEDTENGAQGHVMMSTAQVVKLLESMKEKVCNATDEEDGSLPGM